MVCTSGALAASPLPRGTLKLAAAVQSASDSATRHDRGMALLLNPDHVTVAVAGAQAAIAWVDADTASSHG